MKQSIFFICLLFVCTVLVGCGEDSLLGDAFLSDKPRTTIELDIQKDLTLKAELSPYFLIGKVTVESGATLTIEPGTEIRGVRGTRATLVVSQGARILAEGTPSNPIVFTSDAEVGTRTNGDWGGIVINGAAPLNTQPGVRQGEGDTGFYGGNDALDDSGVLSYVRIEFAGDRIDEDTELNGLTLQGVGRGTQVDHIHVHKSEDDCFEFFGGTVDARYLICSDGHDDGFDFTEGWTGHGQFWIARMRQENTELNRDSNGIEGTNANGETSDFNASPRSLPRLANITLVGDPASNNGVKLNRGASLHLYNSIISDFVSASINVQHLEGCSSLILQGVVLEEEAGEIDGECDVESLSLNTAVSPVRPVMDPFDDRAPNFASSGLAVDGTFPPIALADPFFVPTTFIGAQSPVSGGDDWNWGADWITFPDN